MIDFTPPIPTQVVQFVKDNFIIESDHGGIAYIMKWNGKKFYSPSLAHSKSPYNNFGISAPIILMFDGRNVKRVIPNEEYIDFKKQQYSYYTKRTKNCYKKLDKNLNKTKNEILTNTENIHSSIIPNIVTKYADKYILKYKKRKIEYLYTWKGIMVYRVYYQIKPQTFPHQKIILLYDGKTVKRANEEEMKLFCHECSDYYHYSRFSKYKKNRKEELGVPRSSNNTSKKEYKYD